MKINIAKTGVSGWVAVLDNDGDTMYASQKHPRPGCAVREVLNWLYFEYGAPDQISIDLSDW